MTASEASERVPELKEKREAYLLPNTLLGDMVRKLPHAFDSGEGKKE